MLTAEELTQLSRGKTAKKPVFLMIRLLKKCTAKCQMCNIWKGAGEIPWESLENMIMQAFEAGIKEICFTGGEPTAYFGFFKAIKLIKQLGLNYSLITNGSNLSRKNVRKMMKFPPSRVFVSIDSPDPKIHDEIRGVIGIWAKAMNGICEFNKFEDRPKLIVNYVISKNTFRQVPEMISLGNGKFDEINLMQIKGMPDWQLTKDQIYYYNYSIVPKIMAALRKSGVKIRSNNPFIFGQKEKEIQSSTIGNYSAHSSRKNQCSISKIMLFVETNGEAFPCNNSPYYGAKFSLGNSFKQPLMQILNSEKAENVRCNISSCNECRTCDPINQETNRQLQALASIKCVERKAWKNEARN